MGFSTEQESPEATDACKMCMSAQEHCVFGSRHWDLGSLIFTKLFLLCMVLLPSSSLPISTIVLHAFVAFQKAFWSG